MDRTHYQVASADFAAVKLSRLVHDAIPAAFLARRLAVIHRGLGDLFHQSTTLPAKT